MEAMYEVDGPCAGSSRITPRTHSARLLDLDDGPECAIPLVGIGASAGGLEALTLLVAALPDDVGMAFFVVQHLDPALPSALVELLARATTLSVVSAHDGAVPEPNVVYVVPPGTQLTMDGHLMRLEPNGESRHRPVDIFLRSLALSAGHRAIGILLSGSGSDGRLGLTAIREAGGFTLVQDDTARFPDMPRAAIKAGVVDRVLPPSEIAAELVALKQHPYVRGEVVPGDVAAAPEGDAALIEILDAVHGRRGVDFSGYKSATLHRRILRRMVLRGVGSLPEYAKMVVDDPAEVDALFEDILISVTEFFRDPEVFERLRTTVLRGLVERQGARAPLRIWVIGCSTGEEAYSIAMTVREYQGTSGRSLPIKIFATDVNDTALAIARRGIYAPERVALLTAERRRRFFDSVSEGLQVRQEVRELCIFARHDITCDPPLSRMDLVSCRNVLIYLGRELQERVVPILHYALRPGGVLLLGRSESIGHSDDLFEASDQANHVYARRATSHARLPNLRMLTTGGGGGVVAMPSSPDLLTRQADRYVVAHYAPAGVIVDADLRVLHFRGDTSSFLSNPPGAASLHLLKLAHPDVHPHLVEGLRLARERGEEVTREGVRVRGTPADVSTVLRVVPLSRDGMTGYLVLFESTSRAPTLTSRFGAVALGYGRSLLRQLGRGDAEDSRSSSQRELTTARSRLHGLIDEHEAKTEELTAAIEEVRSSNEELQSTNEELQTAKEEVLASNEELTTVNEELEARNTTLARSNDDQANLLSSTNIPIVMVDQDRRIRWFTPSAALVLDLIPGDLGQPFDHIKLGLDLPLLETLINPVLDDRRAQEHLVQDAEHRWYRVTVSPYRRADDSVDGVVIAFVDIDALKRAEAGLLQERTLAQWIVETVRQPLVTIDDALVIVSANRAYCDGRATTEAAVLHRSLLSVDVEWDTPALRAWLESVMAGDHDVEEFVVNGGEQGRQLELRAHRIVPTKDRHLLLIAVEDVTARSLRERSEAELVSGVLAAQAEERAHLARELHDETGQALSALLVGLRAASERIVDPGVHDLVAELRERVRELLDSVGRLARGLHPPSLEELGLGGAIRELAEEFGHVHALAVDVRVDGEQQLGALPSATQLVLYRVIQEGLTNVARHARAGAVTLRVTRDEREVTLQIVDDGQGLGPDASTRTGLGLRLMRRRVAQLHGKLSLRAAPRGGTALEIVIPTESSDA